MFIQIWPSGSTEEVKNVEKNYGRTEICCCHTKHIHAIKVHALEYHGYKYQNNFLL